LISGGSIPTEGRDPKGYSPETVLTIEQVAEWLQVSKRSAEDLHIPCFYLGTRTRRYLAKHVLEYIEAKAA
jgi:hypothetical protein